MSCDDVGSQSSCIFFTHAIAHFVPYEDSKKAWKCFRIRLAPAGFGYLGFSLVSDT
jgi:hypothetical protein